MASAAAFLLPFMGTAAGSFTVFFMNKILARKTEKLLTGFASGVMLAASVWSLLIPAIEMNSGVRLPWAEAAGGFLSGIAVLMIMKKIITTSEIGFCDSQSGLLKDFLLVLAITVHNFPEGMAVGVMLAGLLDGVAGITPTQVVSLSVGIALQNFPEGAIISMPLKSRGTRKIKAFLAGVLSGVVEPLGVFVTLLLADTVKGILPFLLAFAAGAMVHVVADDLIPDSETDGERSIVTAGVAAGFTLMMILDVALG